MKTSNLIITVATVIALCDTALAQVDHSGYPIYSGDSVVGVPLDGGPAPRGATCSTTVYSNMESGAGFVSLPVSAVGGTLGNEDYDSIADADFTLDTFRFVGGVTNAGEMLFFDFYDSGGAFVDGFGVAFGGGGNFIYTITSGGASPLGLVLPDTGFLEIVAGGSSAGQWFGSDAAPTVGTEDDTFGTLPVPFSHKFQLNAFIPDDEICDGLDNDCDGSTDEGGVCVFVDIKPGSCPNSYNRSSRGVLPVALLGTSGFDVSQVDMSSVALSRADGVGGSVSPHEGPPGPHSVLADTATPFVGAGCDCHELAGDGITDLSMKFKTTDVVSYLQLDAEPSGALVELTVSGNLFDGTAFSASDCVRLVPPGSPPGLLAVQSNLSQSWIDASPLDLQLDGGGFGSFERTWPLSTLVTFTTEETADGLRFVGWKLNGQFVSTALSIDRTVEDETGMVEAAYAKAADLTGDGRVDLTDFAEFALCFGSDLADTDGPCSTESVAASDLDRDGQITLFDFGLFASLFGQ